MRVSFRRRAIEVPTGESAQSTEGGDGVQAAGIQSDVIEQLLFVRFVNDYDKFAGLRQG
jgi:hypothetical protein